MAYNNIEFEHPNSKAIKQAPVGFSWTTLFFGFFPAVLRGDWKWGIIMLLAAWLSMGLSWLVFPFFYNKLYIKSLIAKGFKANMAQTSDLEDLSAKIGINIPVLASP